MADANQTEVSKRGAYITLDASDKVLSTDSVTAAMWSDNNPTLRQFRTSSAQVTSAVKEYYTSVYQTASTGVTAATEIATIGLGKVLGTYFNIFGNLFAIFAMATGFLALGVALKEMYEYDYNINKY